MAKKVELDILDDYKELENGMIAKIEANSTASIAHKVGSYFYYQGYLYITTVDIAAGASIIPNTNCKKAVLGDDVADLKESFNDMITVTSSDNYTNPSLTYGATIDNTTGVITAPNNYYRCSAKIPCQYGETIYILQTTSAYTAVSVRKTANDKVAFYTSGDEFINIGYNEDSYAVPQNAAYCVQQGGNAMMRDGQVGIFKKSIQELGNAWVAYSETKKLDYDYTPDEVIEKLSEFDELKDEAQYTLGENVLGYSALTFKQDGSNRVISEQKIPVLPNRKYTLSYTGSADNSTTIYIEYYNSSDVKMSFDSNNFKYSSFTFVTPPNTSYIIVAAYQIGLTPQTFPLENPCLVYGYYPAIETVPYKREVSASTMPDMPERLYTNNSAIISLGHMGLSYYFPQNTKWSWLGAKKAGFDYIECDLQMTSDGKIVLIHDLDMRRYGGTESQTVNSLTYAQMNSLFDAGTWFDPRYTGTQFPLFDDFVGFAKALGMKLALDCKDLATVEQIDAIADILEKWSMEDEVIWISGQFARVWDRMPNAKIMWPTSNTLINGQYEDITDGWFSSFARNFPADKKTVVDGRTVVADGVWFCVDQNISVTDTYGLTDLQQTAELCRKYNCKYGLYAIDDNDDMYDYITSIPYLHAITSNRITPQAAICQKFGIGISNRPQDIGQL